MKKRWNILRTPSFFNIKTQIRIINVCFVLHNFIRDEHQIDQLLEARDSKLLYDVDQKLTPLTKKVQNNVTDDVTTIRVTDERTRFCDKLALNMFANYQVRRNFS